jgi:hypothetical protein
MWFLVKILAAARVTAQARYYFYHEDYIKLNKMLSFTIHRSAVEDVLKKMRIIHSKMNE